MIGFDHRSEVVNYMKKFSIWLLLFPACLFFAACSSSPNNSNKPSLTPTVIVTVSPYQTWVKHIAGDTLNVKILIPENFNPHIYEATPKQMNELKNASIWFTLGDPVELKLIKTLSWQNKHLQVINLSENLNATIGNTLSVESCHHHHDSVDTHYWLSPSLAMKQCEEIKNALCELYPKHAVLYRQNFKILRAKFKNTIRSLSLSLVPVKNKAFIISHPALSYFANEFDLYQISIECEGKSPKPKDLQKIRSFAKNHPVLCAFTLASFDNKGTIAVAKDLQIPVFEFNPHSQNYFENLGNLTTYLLESN